MIGKINDVGNTDLWQLVIERMVNGFLIIVVWQMPMGIFSVSLNFDIWIFAVLHPVIYLLNGFFQFCIQGS